MTMANEFSDLGFVGKLVDDLLKTGIQDYAFVYEWKERVDGEFPPVAVLVRTGRKWRRRQTKATEWHWDDEYGGFIFGPAPR
jgi:hypothetical protein